MDVASSSTTAIQSRQKRVLPSRSTRGGPGVGNCDMDMLILDTQKRRSENEPLIPTNTRFLFTTDSSYSVDQEDGTQANIQLNTVAFDRYFEKPEVLHAFREQSIIEIPVFESIAELTSVGGRFRPRGAEDESAETSDAAYERRHKKYEAAEKRHRSREKEKLKHEHYKLKERIEQLRAMDSAAFMSVPASYFSPPPPGLANVDQTEVPTSSVYTTAFNGPTPNPEGDRRKEEMLNMALALEQRYRALLPSEKHRKAHDINIPESSIRTPVVEEDSDGERVAHARKDDNLRLRLPARTSNSSTPVPSPSVNRIVSKKSQSFSSKLPQAVRVLKQANQGASSPVSSMLTAGPSGPTTPSADVEMGTPEPIENPVPISPSQPPLSDERSSSNIAAVYVDHSMAPPISTLVDVTAPEKKKKTYKKKGQAAEGPSSKQPARRGRPSLVRSEVAPNDEGESEKDFSDEEGKKHAPVKNTTKGRPRGKAAARQAQVDADEAAPEVRELSTRMQQTTGLGSAEHDTPMAAPEIACETSQPATEDEQDELIATPPPEAMTSASTGPSRPQKRRKTTQKALEIPAELASETAEQESVGGPEPAESSSVATARRTIPRGAKPYISEDGEQKYATCDILLVALRSGGSNFREEKRHQKAFGVALPEILKHEYFYELPDWVHPVGSDPSQYRIEKRRSVSTRPSRRIQSATPVQQPIQSLVTDEANEVTDNAAKSDQDAQVDQEMHEPLPEETRVQSPEVQESYERGARTPEPGKPLEKVEEVIEQREGSPSPEKIPGVVETPNLPPNDVEMADNTQLEPSEAAQEPELRDEDAAATLHSTAEEQVPVTTPQPEPEIVEEQPVKTRRGGRRAEKPPSKRQPKRGAKKAMIQESPVPEEPQGQGEKENAMEVVSATVTTTGLQFATGNGAEAEGAASPQTDTTEIWANPHILPRDLSSKPNDDEEALEW
ncbi:hypothetical protein CVT24_001256 [Panaeolus cyanescens]|uniref:PEHE domain-containing protein n=1 Tax=Panaeolus cyanescens TaxID=181874 RepID=A0A409YFX6_9AGAR|nr:hypothetical protein CVT24_001256 [Panaeolus cyanescens]